MQAQIHDLMVAAFKEPLVAPDMIGFRFTVGGGKKVRQKYGDEMPKSAPVPPIFFQPTSLLFASPLPGSGVGPAPYQAFAQPLARTRREPNLVAPPSPPPLAGAMGRSDRRQPVSAGGGR